MAAAKAAWPYFRNGPTVETITSPLPSSAPMPAGSDTSATAVSSSPPSSRARVSSLLALRPARSGDMPRSTIASAARRPVYPVAPKRTIRPATSAVRGRAALLDNGAHPLHGLRHRLLHPLHVPAGERDQPHVGLGHHGGGPAVLLEQADLAEEVAGSEVGNVLAVAQHLGLALLDGHELVGEVALSDEIAPLVHGLLLGERRDLRQLI